MRLLRISILLFVTISTALFGQDDTHYYLMSYFKNSYPPLNDMAGGFFALSTDGINWTEMNDGAPIIPGSPIGEKLMRDPSIYFDQATMTFRLVYTTGWTMKCLGYSQITIADGKDFKNFQNWDVLDAQNNRQIPIYVSDSIPGSICTWAPEIFWDDIQNKYMIYWSTDVGQDGKRSYYVMTSDFKTFTNPVKFFDPGYSEIDGNISKIANGNYLMVFKDERDGYKRLYSVTAPTPQGPWGAVSANSISNPNLLGVEGPATIKMGNEYRVYFDPYNARQNYRMIKSTDLITWTDGGTIKSGGSNFTFSHCNIIEIPKYIHDWITTGTLAVHQKPKTITPAQLGSNRFTMSGTYSLLGKKLVSVDTWNRTDKAAPGLPAGCFISVDATKGTGSFIQKTR